MRALTTAAILLLFAGCVTTTRTTTAQAPATGVQTFTGEVWTWDRPNNTVTLFKDGKAGHAGFLESTADVPHVVPQLIAQPRF